jgi:hypothetical protein
MSDKQSRSIKKSSQQAARSFGFRVKECLHRIIDFANQKQIEDFQQVDPLLVVFPVGGTGVMNDIHAPFALNSSRPAIPSIPLRQA